MRSLKTQLIGSHLVLVLLMAMVTASAILSFIQLSHSLGTEIEKNIRALQGARTMASALKSQDVAFASLIGGRPGTAEAIFIASKKEFDSGLSVARANAIEASDLLLLDDLDRQSTELFSAGKQILDQNQLSVHDDAEPAILQRITPLRDELVVRIQQFTATNETSLFDQNRIRRAETKAAIDRALFVTVIAIGLALLLAARMIRKTLPPLEALASRASKIALGDLTTGEKVQRTDEIGVLLKSFDEMAERLSELRKTHVRRLIRAERMSDAALEHLYDPVLVTDGKGRVAHMNRAAENLFGPLKKSPRPKISDVVHDHRIQKAIAEAVESRETAAPEDFHSFLQFEKNGHLSAYRLRVTPMYDDDGKHLGSVAVLEDVTQLREVDRLKSEFIGVAAHELRTSVASLILSAELLEEGALGPLTEEQLGVVKMQREDLQRLEGLMRDLLDVTRLDSRTTRVRLETMMASSLVVSTVKSLKSQAATNGVDLHAGPCDADVEIHVDRGQISRVLTNLVTNAIRHTPSGGTVEVCATHADNEVTFSVRDSGEGIPEEYLKKIFDRFVQVPGATQGGAGLGLSIADEIVRAHGGRINPPVAGGGKNS